MLRRKLKILSLLFILFVVNVQAQQYCFQQFSLAEGLPQSEVKEIIQTDLSTFWVITNGGGVVEFDGKRFNEINFPDGYIDNEIYSIFKDESGKIYIAGKNALAVYDGIKIKNYSKEHGYDVSHNVKITQNPKTKDIILYSRESIQKSYIAKIDGDSIVSLAKTHPELSEINILTIFQDVHNEVLYLTSQNGFYILSDNLKKKNIRFKNFEKYPYVIPMGQFSDTLFLALLPPNARSAILLLKTSEKVEQIPSLKNTELSVTKKIKRDNKGKYWFVTRSGIAYYDGENMVEINKGNGLPVGNVLSLETDFEGNIWVGTTGAGLLRYCGDEMIRYTENEGLKSNIVRGFIEFESKMWISTEGGGISALNPKNGKLVNYKSENNSSENNAYTLVNYKNKLLSASRAGILEFQNNRFVNVNNKFKLTENIGIHFISVNNDSLWMLPTRGGVLHYYQNQLTNYKKEDGLLSNLINSLFCDSKGRVWVNSLNGVNYIENGQIFNVFSENKDNKLNIIQAAEDINGNIWFASFSQGIFIFDGKEQLLPVDNISQINNNFLCYSILIDSDNDVWLGRQQGIFRYKILSENKIKEDKNWLGNTGNLECNGNAAYIDSNKKLWFGTIQGAVSLSPTPKSELKSKPRVFINDLKLFLNTIDWSSEEYSKYYDELIPWTQLPKNPQLPFKLNHLSFSINAIDFSESNNLKCSWYLDGFDNQWSPISKQDIISYSNLPPGNYTFKVKTVNRQNDWSDIAEYEFEIVEPLWKSTIFQLIFTFILLLVISLLVVLRLRRLKRNKIDLEILVGLKTKEIMQQNAEILTQNKILERQKSRISKTVERLKDSYSDLALLNEIGKDISYSLSSQTIIDKVYENLNTLLDAAIFGIGIYKKESNSLEFISAKEKGKVLPIIHLSLKETDKLAVMCLLGNEEIFISDFDEEYKKYGKTPILLVTQQIPSSLFYVPLTIADRKIGILTVQSLKKYAYDDYHLNLIRNIAIYTGIALVNAETYEQLKDKKQNLETANNFINEKNKQIEKKNDELNSLNEEKNKLIRIVAHDLRNPLTAGITSLDILLKSEKEISTKGIKQFEHLKRSMWRMNEMIGKILDVRAIEKKEHNINIEKLSTTPILIDLIHEYQNHAESKQIEFNFIPLNAKQYIYADKAYLTQIFDNLISNAVKFSPSDTKIEVKETLNDDSLRICIKNSGQGFKPEELEELFKTFKTFSAKPTGNEKSSGIGLSVVKKYIDEMDGKVWCDSKYGEGAEFYVEFDLIEDLSEKSIEK